MSTAILNTTAAHDLGASSIQSRLASCIRDINPAAVSAGVTAFIFYTTAGAPLLLAITAHMGLDAAHISSWFFVVFFTTAVSSIALSLAYRQPLPVNWSLPGLVYLGSAAGHFSFAELVGANLMAGGVILLVGALGIGSRLVAVLPLPIAMGMFAGSILANVSALVTATVDDALIAGATISGYLIGRAIDRRSLPPVALAALAGACAVALGGRAAPAPVPLTLPVVLLPEATFSASAFFGVSLPLVALSVGLGNVQGLGFLLAQGYSVRVNVLTLVTGGQSLLNAVFGGHQAMIGRSGAAILGSPAAGPVEGRYWASLVANGLLVPVAFAAAPLAALVAIVPPAYVASVAGLAILPSFQDALTRAVSGRLRLGAITAFVVAATPFTVAGITSALWAILAGLVVSAIAERADLRTGGAAIG